MPVISKAEPRMLRERFPKGTHVKLIRIDDPQAPPVVTRGTVQGVDDIGSILIDWEMDTN